MPFTTAQSPQQFARKLQRMTVAVQREESRAIAARALVTKRYIVEAAIARTRKARPNWVQYRINGDTAVLRLRGGMAHLLELGSHNAPEGWDEAPRESTARRRRAATKRGETFSQAQALRTPYGPKASVHHPAIKGKDFWRKGIVASRPAGQRAYQRVVHETILTGLR